VFLDWSVNVANENAPTSSNPVIWTVGHTPNGHCLNLRIFSVKDPGTVEVKITLINDNVDPPERTSPAKQPVASFVRADPWIHFSHFFFPAPKDNQAPAITRAEVTVTAGGNAMWGPQELYVGLPPSKKAAQVAVRTPRLSASINSSEQAKPAPVSSITAASLNALLKTIWSRLSGPMDVAWLGPDGTQGLPPDTDDSFIVDPWGVPEEAWAQAHAQMFFGVPYQSCGAFALNDSARDGEMFQKMQDATDPAHPLTAACQQLCSLAAITRGIPLGKRSIDCALYRFSGPDPTDPATGSKVENPNLGLFKSLGGTWHDPGDKNIAKAFQLDPPLAPGSMFMFALEPDTKFAAPSKPGQKPPAVRSGGVPHIAFVIRTRPPAHVQFFDTGAITPANRSAADLKQFPNSGIQEYLPISQVGYGGNGDFRGIGVLPTPSAADLRQRVGWMRTVRPLGLARLAIHRFDGSKKTETLLVTPLVRMHFGSECFPISRFLWSLRDLPGGDLLRAEWWLYGERLSLMEVELQNDTRALSIADMIANCRYSKKDPRTGHMVEHSAVLDNTTCMPLILARNDADGLVTIQGRFDRTANHNWAGKESFGVVGGTIPATNTFWLSATLEPERKTLCTGLPDYYTSGFPSSI
jgi:hypothetical protein